MLNPESADFLLVTGDLAPKNQQLAAGAIASKLGRSQIHTRSLAHGALFLFSDSPLHLRFTDGQKESVVVRECCWPDPVGLFMQFSRCSCDVQGDLYGLRPIYFGSSVRGTAVSTRAEVVASLVGGRVSREGMVQLLSTTFTLGGRSMFEAVTRLQAGQVVRWRSDRPGLEIGSVDEVRVGTEVRSIEVRLAEAAERAASAFEEGHALELSGGVDSRLVLAMGLSLGSKPRLAITVGDDDAADVVLARRICDLCNIPHVVMRHEAPAETVEEDGREFVGRANFEVDAGAYAWMPSLFRRLAPLRAGQISGFGGECAKGSYYSWFDALCGVRELRRAWIRNRLMSNGAMSTVFRPSDAREVIQNTGREIEELLDAVQGTWRERTDEFYLSQKMAHWVGQVVTASSSWYHVRMPLFSRGHIEWARSLTVGQRAGRRSQRDLLRRLHPDLAGLPFASDLAKGGRSTGPLAGLKKGMSKVVKRLRGRAGNAFGSEETIRVLATRFGVRSALSELFSDADLGLYEAGLDTLLAHNRQFAREIGVLLTASWARQALIEWKRVWGQINEPMLVPAQ